MAVPTGLDEALSAAPQEPAVDRAQRCRQALGAEEPEPPVRPRRVVRHLSGRSGDPVSSTGGDDHGLDVLAGSAHHRGVVELVRGQRDRRGLAGDLVAWLRLFNAERAEHDPAQFYDLDYFALIKDRSARSRTSTGRSGSTSRRMRGRPWPAPTRRASRAPGAEAHLLARGLRADRGAGQGAIRRTLTCNIRTILRVSKYVLISSWV